MNNIVGQKFIFAVAQRPFEATSQEGGVVNHFCALLPLFDMGGNIVSPSDFPDNGDVWWMLRPGTRGFAEPGRLLTGCVEDAIRKGEPGRAQFQVIADSVEPIRGRDYVEIVDLQVQAIAKPRDLVARGFQLSMDRPPLDTVYIRWGDRLIGPLRTASRVAGRAWNVTFSPESPDNNCLLLPRQLLTDIPKKQQLHAQFSVTSESKPIHESTLVQSINCLLVEVDALGELTTSDASRVSLRSDEQIVQQLAKRFLTRSKRQLLGSALSELSETISASSEPIERDEASILDSLQTALESDVKLADQLAEAILATGILSDQLRLAIDTGVEKHVEENAGRLQAEINKKIAEARGDLEKLQKDRKQIATELHSLRSNKHKELEQELKLKKAAFDENCKQERLDIDRQLAELKRQQKVLSQNLQEVAQTLGERGDQVVNQFLTIAPLLKQFGLLPEMSQNAVLSPIGDSRQIGNFREIQDSRRPLDSPAVVFELPIFKKTATQQPQSEEEFFDRFKQHVAASGFRYRDIDLAAFHVSVKCGDLTILGGLPGTGKSSLPRLYAAAITGDASDEEGHLDRFLHVSVSPSWLDMRDLLGHVNALNQTFQPADTSLFQQLVFAQEESSELADDSGLYFICLDEMNLSHVEHYFSGFLQVLEMPEGERKLRCFPENLVSPTSPFSNWSSILISSAVRFIGTVNFDETTKQLSQRLLDRANVMRLPANQLPLELSESVSATVSGRQIRLSSYRTWVQSTATFGDELGGIVDELRDDLKTLNCPMNPRRFSAMRKFLASWPSTLPHSDQALDIQLAQRVLPQIRGLFQPGARLAVDSIRRKLEGHSNSFPESLRVLDEITQTERIDFLLESEAS